MKQSRRFACAIALLWAADASVAAERPGKAEILEIARSQVATLPWGSDATLEVAPGAGGVLSRWVVLATCADCDVASEQGIVAIGFDQDGRVNCAVPVGTYVCGDEDKLDGGETRQRLRARDARRHHVEIVERYRSGGTRILSLRLLGN